VNENEVIKKGVTSKCLSKLEGREGLAGQGMDTLAEEEVCLSKDEQWNKPGGRAKPQMRKRGGLTRSTFSKVGGLVLLKEKERSH